MCGIAGVVRFNQAPIATAVFKHLSATLHHRGPDDVGFLSWSGASSVQVSRDPDALQSGWVGLIHLRLSIVDLTRLAWQPMSTLDGRYHLVFNGEIYNYLELRVELEASGYAFRSQSDSEVVLAAYACWGASMLRRLIGMFSFSLLDIQSRTLFLARDCFGIKPLYYTLGPHGFAFASEIKALLGLPEVHCRVNPQRLYDYLCFGVTDHGGGTLFAEILQVPSAHYLVMPLDNPSAGHLVRYWQLDLHQDRDLSLDEAAEKLRDLFLENLRLHLRSDAPVGVALSGGIDSSSIAMATRYLRGTTQPVPTFSYVADEAAISEESWADIIIQAGRTTGHKVHPEPNDLATDLEMLVEVQGEPFRGPSMYAEMRLLRLAQEAGIKVMLHGHGADELLGGYRASAAARLASLVRQERWSEAYRFLQQVATLPGATTGMLLSRLLGLLALSRFPGSAQWLMRHYLSPLWLNETWFAKQGVIPGPTWHNQQETANVLRERLSQLMDYGLPGELRCADRSSMICSIESRTPFLTQALAEFLFSLPEDHIIASNGTTKAVFRRAMRGIVPASILERQDKMGFATPDRKWVAGLRPWVDAMLRSEVVHQIPALRLAGVERAWRRIWSGHQEFDLTVWRWINVICWAKRLPISFA